jgi:DNA-binding response OmpR family regulator
MSFQNVNQPQIGQFSTILIVEDDKMVSSLMKAHLEKSGFIVEQVFRGDLACRTQIKVQPDLIILDVGLPGKDGFHVCHELRKTFKGPILFLTARDSDAEQITAFNIGADDYLIKPVNPNLLKVRIEALLRRQPKQTYNQKVASIHVGEISLTPSEQKCEVNGRMISLSSFEFELLTLLMTNVSKVLTRDSIYTLLLGREYDGSERSVDVRVSRLRDKLIKEGVTQAQIKTVWGKGYVIYDVEKQAQ